MKVLVGGGSGFIGSHLRRLLEHHGHEMINVTRKAKLPTDIPWTQIERFGIPKGMECVVNLAGTNIMSPSRWTKEFQQELVSSRVETTEILCRAVRMAEDKPKSYINSSAIGYYGAEDRGEEMDEDSPVGEGFAADLCKKWEAAADLSGTDVRKVIIRIGLALARDGGTVKTAYWPFFFNLGGTIGGGKQWFPWIHALDVAGIMLHCMETPSASGVYNAVAPQAVTNSEFTIAFSRSMWRFAPFPMPKFVLSQLLGDERADLMTKSPKIVPKRTLESGYEFVYDDIKLACADCVKWGHYDVY